MFLFAHTEFLKCSPQIEDDKDVPLAINLQNIVILLSLTAVVTAFAEKRLQGFCVVQFRNCF